MNKTILFLGMFACFIVASIDVVAQKRYNDLAVNNLYGSVKKVETQITVYDEGWGYRDNISIFTFTPNGYYIDGVMGFHYEYASDNGTYVCKTASSNNNNYVMCKFRVQIQPGERLDRGGYWEYEGGKKVGESSDDFLGLISKFDMNGRLVYETKMEPFCFVEANYLAREYFYKGEAIVPYKVNEEIELGGEGGAKTLLYKYESMDVKGNWTKRKAYLGESGKLLMEESRIIKYYTPGEVETYNKIGIYKL